MNPQSHADHSFSSSASDYSLPTPSDNNHQQHHLSQQHQYTPFSLSSPTDPTQMSLPPVSTLHMPSSPYTHHSQVHGHGHSHSLSLSGAPKSPIDFGLSTGGHALSIPKSPLGGGMDFSLGALGPYGGGGGVVSSPLLPINASVSARNGTNGGVGPASAGNGMGASMGAFAASPVLPSSVPSASSPLAGGAAASMTSTINAAGTTTASASVGGGAGGGGGGTADKQSLLANEKRRRRRESHNAVERRRRDNINEKISELATLIPECMLDGGATTTPAAAGGGANGSGGNGSGSPASPGLLDGAEPLLPIPLGDKGAPKDAKDEGDGENGVVKANKGMILRKSVEYIRYLQQLVTAQGARNRELEQELKAYRGSVSSGGSDAGGEPAKKPGHARDMSADSDAERHHHHHGHNSANTAQHLALDQEMMLHDGGGGADGGGGMDFAMGGVYVNGVGMLPSMPEGDDELELGLADAAALEAGGGMEVDGSAGGGGGKGELMERGRTRGVRRNGAAANGNANGASHNVGLKEEVQDEDLGFMVGMQT
ncbi:helix-loop-helix DNA-binding domain-containing protein [Pholiota molesta]|nr:helix-loop-helix DNA-binding domain-containing protein [Pholiota molesta]